MPTPSKEADLPSQIMRVWAQSLKCKADGAFAKPERKEMPNRFDATMSDLIEEMIRSLPPSEMEIKGKEERVKAAAYLLCKNGFKHIHMEPNKVLILGKDEDSLFAVKMARPLSEEEPFDKEVVKELTKTGDKIGIPRENQILVLVEGRGRGEISCPSFKIQSSLISRCLSYISECFSKTKESIRRKTLKTSACQ